jgi:hypothetical protein
MPKFLERKLKKQYGEKSKIPYAVMNKLGYMRGSKETAKGRAAEKKHKIHSTSKIRGLGGKGVKHG